jgi:hypothetical protein
MTTEKKGFGPFFLIDAFPRDEAGFSIFWKNLLNELRYFPESGSKGSFSHLPLPYATDLQSWKWIS